MTNKPHFAELVDGLPLGPHLWSKAITIVCDKNSGGSDDERRAEWLPLFFFPTEAGELTPQVRYDAEDPGSILKQNLKTTTKEQWRILSARANAVRSPLLAGLYSDFLWRQRDSHELKPAVQFAELALERYAHAVRERLGGDDLFWDAILAIQQIARISRELNRPEAGTVAARLLGTLIDSVEPQWRTSPGFLLRAAGALNSIIDLYPPARRSGELMAEADSMLTRLQRFMPEGSAELASFIGRDVLEQRAKLSEVLSMPLQDSLDLQMATSLIQEAEARAAAEDYLVAAELMMDAVTRLVNIGERTRAAEAKKRVRFFYAEGMRLIKPMVMEDSVPVEPARRWIEQCTAAATLREVLVAAVKGTVVIPSWQVACDSAEESSRENILSASISKTNVADGRPVSRGVRGDLAMFREHWLFAINFDVMLHWTPLLSKLKADGRLSADLVLHELEAAQIATPYNQKALAHSLKAALEGDFIIACHMLPAIVESAIRYVLGTAGVDVLAFRPQNGGQIQERTMGALFDEEGGTLADQARTILGDDLWQWYRAVLFDENGLNLRNRAAHGLLRDEECTRRNSDILLLTLVALLRL
jgi:hypothetical protein